MAAPRGSSFTPSKGILAGRTFVAEPGSSPTRAYNIYQQARAESLGFSSYNDQRRAAQSPTFKNLLAGEKGKVTPQRREDLLKAIGQNRRIEAIEETGRGLRYRTVLDVDVKDHRVGGSLDRYLQAIGRRTGQESWFPGETPH